MTKEAIFKILENAISHIDEKFSADQTDSIDDQLQSAEVPFEYSIDNGITKAVILVEGLPYVIKIPFSCRFAEEDYDDALKDWEYDREAVLDELLATRIIETDNDEYCLTNKERIAALKAYDAEHKEPQDEDFYYEYWCAKDIDLDGEEEFLSEWDYCELESHIYSLAVKEGLGAYFAEEGLLGEIDNTPVYYQTRCVPMDTIHINRTSEEFKRKKAISTVYCKEHKIPCFNEVWIADFIELYGGDEFKRLDSFLERYDIGDLRACNIGYLDGAPILFDYSGYRD